MRKLFILLFCLCSLGVFAQRALDPIGSPTGINMLNGIKAKFMGLPVLDTLIIPASLSSKFPDSVFVGAVAYLRADKKVYKYNGNGQWELAGSGTVNNYLTGGTSFTDTVTYTATGLTTTVKIFTGGKLINGIRTDGLNGSGFLPSSGTVGDTTYIYYSVAPYGTVIYIITGQVLSLPAPELSAEGISTTEIALNWNSVEHAIDYEIQYSFDSSFWGTLAIVTDTFYVDGTLMPDEKRYYRARARGDGENYYYSPFSYASAKSAALAQLTKPTITATTISQDSIGIVWSNEANETGYKLQYSLDSIHWIDLAVLAANVTSYIHTNLSASTLYYYQVQTTADNITRSNSDWAVDTAITKNAALQPLQTPVPDAVAVSAEEIDINWPAIPHATAYVISYLNGAEYTLLDTVEVPAYNHLNLTANTQFKYQVYTLGDNITYSNSGNGYDSATTLTVVVAADTLQAPSPLTATGGTRQAVINWNNVPNEAGYVLERSLNKTTWTPLPPFAANVTTYTDTGLIPSTKYYYKAYSVTGDTLHVNSLYSNIDSATTNAATALTAPTLTHGAVTTSSIVWNWNNVANETGYRIQTSADKITWTTLADLAANVITYTQTGLPANTKLYGRVRAKADNINFIQSVYSNIDSATTSVATQTRLATPVYTSSGGSRQVSVYWTNVANETGYQLERSLDSATWVVIATLGANIASYVDTGLQINTTYHYRGFAVGDGITYLNSFYGSANATTISNNYITRFGVLADPGASGMTASQIISKVIDSVEVCIARGGWTAFNNVITLVENLFAADKEVTININSFPADTTRNFVLNSERAAYIAKLDTLFTKHLVKENDTLIVVSNEENNFFYRHIDTAANSPTNSARLYYFNELKVVDSIAKLKSSQFKTANGGVTGKGAMWFVWKNLVDSGKTAQANEFAYAMFTVNERSTLANWETSSPYVSTIKMMKQLFVYYRTASFDYFNVHIKAPVNGIDSSHINPNIIKYIMQGFKNITGKNVICNELGSRSITPNIMAELFQACADNKMRYAIGYDGLSQVTNVTSGGNDVSWRLPDNRTINNIGKEIKKRMVIIQHPN